jgi:hypothetical protein
MVAKKAGRPFVYESENERPVTVSLRMPRDLYKQVQRYVRLRPRMTVTEFFLDAARLKLETPTDPRDIILSDDNTVIQELQAMVDAAVEAALAKRNGQGVLTVDSQHDTPALAHSPETMPKLSYDDNTVIQDREEPEGRPTPRRQRKGGRPRSALGQQILDLLAAHPEGLTAEQLRGYLTPSKPLGDTLQGMKKTGAVTTQGQGRAVRYFAAQG